MTQTVNRFLQLNLGRFQHIEKVLELGIEIHHALQTRLYGSHRRQGRHLSFRQYVESELNGFDQAGGMRQPPVFGLQLVPLLVPKRQRFEFFCLPIELLTLRGERLCVGFQGRELPANVLPAPVCPRHVTGQLRCAGVTIDEIALRPGAQQGLVGMLAVDVDQIFADLLELLHGGGTAVDVRARAARGFNDSAQQAFAFVAREIVFFEILGKGRNADGREFSADFGFFFSFANQPGLGTLAQHGSQRIDEDRFARTGFAGQHGETRLEFQVEPVDDDKISDTQGAQHGRFVIGSGRN